MSEYAAFLRLPRNLRREISTKAQEVARGNVHGATNHGGGVFSFQITSGIVVYVSVEIGTKVTIEHIIG